MGGFSLWHILILAILVLLLFGGNRFSNMMGDLAKGMKQFKQGMADEDEEKRERYEERRRSEPPRQLPRDEVRTRDPIDVTPGAADPAPRPRDEDAR